MKSLANALRGVPAYANPVLGEQLYALCRRATSRHIDRPDEIINQQVVYMINSEMHTPYAAKDAATCLKRRLQMDHPQKQYLAIILTTKVLQECAACVSIYQGELLQEVAYILRTVRSSGPAAARTRQAAMDALRLFGSAGGDAYRNARAQAYVPPGAAGAQAAAGPQDPAAIAAERASLLDEIKRLVEQANASTEILNELTLNKQQAAASGSRDESAGLRRELLADLRELRRLFDGYMEGLARLSGPDAESAMKDALEAVDQLDNALTLEKDMDAELQATGQLPPAGEPAAAAPAADEACSTAAAGDQSAGAAGAAGAEAQAAAAGLGSVNLIDLDDEPPPAPPAALGSMADPFAPAATAASPAAAGDPFAPAAAADPFAALAAAPLATGSSAGGMQDGAVAGAGAGFFEPAWQPAGLSQGAASEALQPPPALQPSPMPQQLSGGGPMAQQPGAGMMQPMPPQLFASMPPPATPWGAPSPYGAPPSYGYAAMPPAAAYSQAGPGAYGPPPYPSMAPQPHVMPVAMPAGSEAVLSPTNPFSPAAHVPAPAPANPFQPLPGTASASAGTVEAEWQNLFAQPAAPK